MSSQIQQILNILVGPPGNLVYHIILTFSVAGAWQAAFSNWSRGHTPQARRLVIGLSLLLAVRILLFLGAAAAWQGLMDEYLLPPLDRALNLFSLVIIVWLWAFPEPAPSADAAATLLSLLIITLLILALVSWSSERIFKTTFNGTWIDMGGEFLAVALLVGGIVTLAIRRPTYWGYGLGMLLTLLAGHVVYLTGNLLGPTLRGDYAGPVRLFQMAAYPFLLLLPQRIALTTPTVATPPPAPVERRRYAADPQLVKALLVLAGERESGSLHNLLTQAVARAMLADVCLLVSYRDDTGQVAVQSGYDLIRDKPLEAVVFPPQDVPVIDSVLRLGRATRLPAGSTSPDLAHLVQALHLERSGNFLAAPVPGPAEAPLAGLVLLSTYSNRVWDAVDQEALSVIAGSLAQLLQHTGTLVKAQAEAAGSRQTLQEAQAETEAAVQARDQAMTELLALQALYQQEQEQVKSLTALIKAQEEAQPAASKGMSLPPVDERLKLLGLGVAALAARSDADGGNSLEGEYLLALEEIARLKNALASANGRPTAPVSPGPGGTARLDWEQREAIKSIAEELRGPNTSVANYAEFLLAESTGNLGDLQRKFLERIKTSTQRAGFLIEDLIQVADSEGAELQPSRASVNLRDPLEAAIAETAEERSARRQQIKIDLPEPLPAVKADPESLSKIFSSLIRNALAVTPEAGEVELHVLAQQSSDGQAYTLVKVGDQGGGIATTDLPRIFSGLYTDETPVILGTGTTCSELAEVRQEVEALQGRIWVDSNPGIGSVFSVLLPSAAPPTISKPSPEGVGDPGQ